MENSGSFTEKWNALREKMAPGLQKTGTVLGKIGYVLKQIGLWIYRLRRVFMAVPVIFAALKIAGQNMQRLPELVGLNLQSTGEFAQMVSREYAVFGPLGVTALCLLLMFFSRKPLYPWLISIFSLAIPVLLLITNMYPA